MPFHEYTLLNTVNKRSAEVVVRAPRPAVLSEAAAMTDANGEVVPFSSTGVNQPLKAAGK